MSGTLFDGDRRRAEAAATGAAAGHDDLEGAPGSTAAAAPVEGSDVLVDDRVRARIRRTGLDETLFVEAGAGSGKTTLLVDRIVNLVLEKRVPLSSVAAITFTEAAASELQSRVRARFEQEQATADEHRDHERAERCRDAIADTDLAAITTLHGFANRMLGEFAVAAGLPPQVRVLDEVSSQLAQEERWERFVDRLYEAEEHRELLQVASALRIPIEPRYLDQSTVRSVAVQFNQNWDRLGPLIEASDEPLDTSFDFAPFDDLVAELAELRHECVEPGDKLNIHLAGLLPRMQAIVSIADPLRKLRAIEQSPRWTAGRGGRAVAWRGAGTKDRVRDLIKQVQEAKELVLAPVIDEVLRRLGRVIAAEVHAAAEARRADGGLEFHDLLVLGRDLLRTNAETRQALHDRYRYVLLDEFQDTDPIQIELAVLIATSAESVGGKPWYELPVEPGRLFFVGDPKQSIYRFRRADIALFLQARDRFAGVQGSAQLATNFRTVRPIVDWVNALFEHEMGEEIESAQPRYQPLTAHRQTPSGDFDALHRPVLLGGPHDDPKISANTLRTLEADDVVGVIRAILADPASWPVFDRAVDAWRPARLDDVTVLLPTRTSLPFLRAALDDADVRYRITTGTLVYHTQEVIDALAALRAIDDPGDELSLVAALRSPLYACSDVDLVEWRRLGGRWDVRAEPPPGCDPASPVARAMAHLGSLWRERWFMTPSALLDRLLRERQAALLAFGDPRTTDVWRRLRFLVEQARSFEEADSGDLRAFCQWASLQSSSMARVHEPLLPETDEAALSIQTIHGSKGLEFPITILSGMTTQMRAGRSGVSVLWGADGAPSVRMKKGVETHEHGARADLEAAMDEFEKVRLAYVATTRARDHLVVSCHHKAGTAAAKTYGGRFWNVFDDDQVRGLARRYDWREVVSAVEVEPEPSAQLGLPLDDRDEWVAARDTLLRPFRTSRVLSATGVARAALSDPIEAVPAERPFEPWIGETRSDQDDDGSDQPTEDLIGRRRGRTGSAIGSAVHAVLQSTDLASPGDLGDLVEQQCAIEGIPDRVGIVARLVRAALASDAVALANEHAHHKELFVTAPVGNRSIEGYVDLLIETPNGLVVVDYKTDSVSSDSDVDAKLAAYELQAAAYAVALEAVVRTPVVECRFVFCTGDGPIERSVQDLPDAMSRVRATLTRS